MHNNLYSWRVTKYNPQKRNQMGSYLDDKEWTDFSEVGTLVSEEGYVRTETNYINAILTFMDEVDLNELILECLEVNSDEIISPTATDFWAGKTVNRQEIKELAKLTLRNDIWCKLSYEQEFFVHFGYDFYMYIGTSKDCLHARKKVQENGLYVEDFVSPHLKR